MDGVLVKAINCVHLLIAIRLGITVPILAKDNFVATTVVVSAQGLKIVLAAEVEATVAEVHPDAVNVLVPRLRQGITIVFPIATVVLVGKLVVPTRVEEVEVVVVSPALATDNQILAIVVLLMNAGRLKVVTSKKAAGGAMMGDGTALAIVPAVGQLVLLHVAMEHRPMVAEPPETAVTAHVVHPVHHHHI